MGIQDEPVPEPAATDGTHLARYDATLEPFMSAQGCCSLIRFSTPVALIFDVTWVFLSGTLGFVSRWANETVLIPG